MADSDLTTNGNDELIEQPSGDLTERELPEGKLLRIAKIREGVDFKGILAQLSQYASIGNVLTHIEKVKKYVVQVPLQYQKALDEGLNFINQNQTTGVM
jgi:hypothetical protein